MNLSELHAFSAPAIVPELFEELQALARRVRRDALRMTTVADSGHIGGALSSIDVFLLLWLCGNISSERISDPDRDRIVVSHGHTAAAVYSVLGNLGYIDTEAAVSGFRKAGSRFEGHPNDGIPGIEWSSGSLGQGLSVGCGFAMAAKLLGKDYRVFVVMGDGEQQKGQISEALDFAAKYRLGNLAVIVDANGLQATGATQTIMPQNIAARMKAAGWRTVEADGHDFSMMYDAFRGFYHQKEDAPVAVIARTHMGRGVSFIEDQHVYHGATLSRNEYLKAAEELGYIEDGEGLSPSVPLHNGSPKQRERLWVEELVEPGKPISYAAGDAVDLRSAAGAALYSVLNGNRGREGVAMAVVDCDLSDSVRTARIARELPECFVECGIQEHNAAVISAALSISGVLTFFAEFGVFGIDEVYGQHRMNDFNGTSLKLLITHVGLDVGEDGKSHQCIDYISLLSNLYNYKLIIPADANQTDRAVRYIATHPGNFVIAMGRSKLPVLSRDDGSCIFGEDYRFDYGGMNRLRDGDDGTIITCGTMAHRAVQASDILRSKGRGVGVLNLSCPHTLNGESLRAAAGTPLIVTYEDHNVRSGIGSIVGTYLAEAGGSCKFMRMGIDQYGSSGAPEELYKRQSLDVESVVRVVEQNL